MPILNKRTTMAASGNAFPLVGDQYEYLPFNALVEFANLADAAAVVFGTIYSGSDLLMQSSQLNLLAVASPILWPDHYLLNDIARAGERLGIEYREGAAGTPIVRTSVRVTPALA